MNSFLSNREVTILSIFRRFFSNLSTRSKCKFSLCRIMNFIGDAGEKLAENVPHTVNRKKFALGGMKIKRTYFDSLTIDARHVGTTNILDFHSNAESLENKTRDAIILLPHSITSALPASVQDLTVVAVTYENDNVFQVDKNTQSAFSGKGGWEI